jgi:glycosyltransferase involved in cell wall biosynthesis
LTCPSELLAQTLREYHWLPPTGCEVQVIPYPFDGSSLATLPPPTDTRPIVMTVGRVEWRKGPDVLIDAAGLLVQRGLPIELLFCGAFAGSSEGLPIEVWLKKRAARLGVTCRFTGHIGREQLLEHYASARVVAVPSRFESFSIAAFEGMAAGRPLVATSSIGAAPFIDRWQSGSVVPANDAPALADALAPFLIDANHATATGARGRTGTATHDSAHIATLRERVYRRAIEAHKLRRASAVRGDVVSAER